MLYMWTLTITFVMHVVLILAAGTSVLEQNAESVV